MVFLHRAIWMAAKRAAADPRVQAKAAEVARDEIVPRIKASVAIAKPELDRAKETARRAADDIRQTVTKHPSVQAAKVFVNTARDRFKSDC